MRKLVNDLSGQRFGRLVAIAPEGTTRKTKYICQCDCGNVKVVRADTLLNGGCKSCGCLKKEQDKINLTKHYSHQKSGTRIYEIWCGMKKRCFNKNNARYWDYGGRGITVCDEWKNSFQSFYDWAMSNGYQENLSIDRIDNNGNYCPENCKWSTNKEQCNNRRSNIKITIGNSTRTLVEWCEIFEVDYQKARMRYCRNGFESIDRLFNQILD